ncbi:hypothetical protein EB796_009291 [Bugula neritina]|uniref:Uncharacterized protein n=1 Tax=Bugula neritina TaxID=10212 RepID=A0A7J7K2J0_BUGNE|nr:hypothetical protein EB796_009291 [Bugula neritina]
MFGCGSRPGDSSCHKGTGANFFLAAVGFTFIFYSILMLVTTLLFSVGSLASTHVCVAVQDPGTTVTALEDNKLPLNVFGNVTIETVLKAYNDCLGGASIEDIASYIDLGSARLTYSNRSMINWAMRK